MKAAELRTLLVAFIERGAGAFRLTVSTADDARALLSALDDATLPRWQPIETAPADTEVIVRVKTGGLWRVREAVGSVDRLGWIWRTSDGTAVDARHWSPIPSEAL